MSTDSLASRLRAASAEWAAAKAAGTAREPDRPRVTLPDGRVHVVGDLTMAMADAMAFLDDEEFEIVLVYSDRNEDRIVWTSADERFIELGLSSGPTVMLGHTVDGDVPAWAPGSHTHARDIVPADVASTLPDIELAPGETDITTTLPACTAWARAALAAYPTR